MAANPWDKRPDESLQAFAAFVLYREGTDNISEVARGLEKSDALLRKWSRRYAWQERRDAWVATKDTTTTKAALRAIAETEEERVRGIAEMNNRHAGVAMSTLHKMYERLKTVKVEDIKVADLPYWLEVAVKVERMARGVATSGVAVTGKEGGAIALDIRQAAEERISSIIGSIVDAGAASDVVGKPN